MTKEEPLGSLPLPLRSAVLAVAERRLGPVIQVEWAEDAAYGPSFRYVNLWGWQETHKASAPANTAGPPSLHNYFEHHGLLPRGEVQDEHFAERLFVERVFIPLFGLQALACLHPQVTFCDPNGGQRAIDFVLDNGAGRRYALEIEGRTYHQAPASSVRFARIKFRQRALVQAGYHYLPIAYSEIDEVDALPAREALLQLVEADHALRQLLDAPSRGEQLMTTAQQAAQHWLFETMPVRFPRCQAWAIDLLRAAHLSGETSLEVWEEPEDGPLLLLALLDALALAERVAALYAIDEMTLPAVTIHRWAGVDPLYKELASEYLHAELVEDGVQPDRRRDKCAHTVIISHGGVPSAKRDGGASRPIASAWDSLRSIFGPDFPTAPALPAHDLQALAPLANYFARRYFPLSELKPEQIQLLQRALAGHSSIGILPTGFGKSLVFQLYALLTPGTTLVISPLKSLIHDQLTSMRRIGLGCVHAITSKDAPTIKQWTLKQLAAHRIRLLYVSPERLRIKSFYAELFPPERPTPVCALFIDEVHCISEWGHDFRPAYLAIGDLVRKIGVTRGSPIPVIGLTATASRDVRSDILEVLQLTAGDVVQLSSSDRANLSLSVHQAGEDIDSKTKLLAALLYTTLPAMLRIPSLQLLAHPPQKGEQYSGVVFGMYANAHGKTMIAEGVHHIAQELRTTLSLPEEAIGIYASGAPSVCPQCGSATYLSRWVKTNGTGDRANSRREFWCPTCEATFDHPQLIDKDLWQEQQETAQDSFYRGDFPIMVATKSYGMGIDKRDIRYIVHHAISGGMESYYQEAGRAGRDGRPAHVALICKLPDRRCYDAYLLREAPPPCVTEEDCVRYYKCAYSSAGLCDAGRQARFIADSYPGIELDVQNVVAVYKELRDRKGAGLQVRTKMCDEGEADVEKQKDLALHRLQQLGLISNFTKEYQSESFVRYEVERAEHWTAKSVIAKLEQFLMHSGVAPEAAAKALSTLRQAESCASGPMNAEVRYAFLEAATRCLLQRVYDRVPRMRYTMLSSLLRYAFNDQGCCRRLYIRTYFDDLPPDDNYRCEFCDACHPDLQFDRREAVVPQSDWQLEHITKLLPRILTTFEAAELQQVITMAVTKIAVVSLFEKINRVLEDDATNLAALYLTGALARRQQGMAGLGLERLRFAFAEGERQGLNQAQLSFIYTEARAIDAAAAFELIDRKHGAFDNLQGLALLEKSVTDLHGPGSVQHRTVHSLRRVRGRRSLCASMAALAEQLQQLHEHLPAAPVQSQPATNQATE